MSLCILPRVFCHNIPNPNPLRGYHRGICKGQSRAWFQKLWKQHLVLL